MRRYTTIRLGAVATLFLLVVGVHATAHGADFAKRNNEANKLVQQGKLDQALDQYKEAAVERPDVPEIDYNIGNVYHLRDQYDSAAMEYQDALATLEGPVQPNAFYNLGNTLFRMQKYDLAAESYKRALMENPSDKDAKYNLELAMQRLKEDSTKQQQQDKDKKNQPDSSQQNQDQKQDKNQNQGDKSDSTQQQQSQPQQQNADSSQIQQQPQGESQDQAGAQQQQGPPPVGMTKEDAERILDALRQRELQVQKQRAQREATAGTPGKDW